DRFVYLVLAEDRLILPEAQAPQPDHNVHDGAPTIGVTHIICRGRESVQAVPCYQSRKKILEPLRRQRGIARRILNIALAAANAILDRGVGKAAQSVALDLNLTKKLDELSDDELIALRDRYAALSGAAPKVIEHLAEQEEGAPGLVADGLKKK